MRLQELPPEVSALLKRNNAPPRLVAHLRLVHDTACQLVARLERAWPDLRYDQNSVLLGAALHDIGKIKHPAELTGDGSAHEAAGEQLLLEQGWPEQYARFARTHGQWRAETAGRPEDLLVALADEVWKGKRDTELEELLARKLAELTGEEFWEAYLKLDEIAHALSEGAHERIIWQGEHSILP